MGLIGEFVRNSGYKRPQMKNLSSRLLLFTTLLFMASSCGVLRKGKKEGCPSDGRNVGAERLLSDPPKKKAKWRGPKSYNY